MIVIGRLVLYLLFLLAIYWPVTALLQWRGPWRLGAGLALMLPVGFIVYLAVYLLSGAKGELSGYALLFVTLGSLGLMGLLSWLRGR